jgi:hypothetical protein
MVLEYSVKSFDMLDKLLQASMRHLLCRANRNLAWTLLQLELLLLCDLRKHPNASGLTVPCPRLCSNSEEVAM